MNVAEDLNQNIVDGITNFLKNLAGSRFFGTVEIQFVDGQIVVVRKEETFKPVIFLSR